MAWHTGNKRLLWQHLTAMVIDKIRKMSVKGVKVKSESFFSISPGVLELWGKNLRGADSASPPPVQMGLSALGRDTSHFEIFEFWAHLMSKHQALASCIPCLSVDIISF